MTFLKMNFQTFHHSPNANCSLQTVIILIPKVYMCDYSQLILIFHSKCYMFNSSKFF